MKREDIHNPATNQHVQREVKPVDGSAPTEQVVDQYTHFFAHSLDLLCIAGFDGYFKSLNPAWTARLGWTLEELQARPFLEFVHPDDREATLREAGAIAEGAATISFENRYRHRDGSYRWLRWNARPAPGRRRIYAIARDVTRLKRLEGEILKTVDRERERLGRELHDGLCQTLAGIAALSSTLSKKLASKGLNDESAAAAEITSLLHESNNQAHDLARGLGPSVLKEFGLDGALESLALNVQHLFQVSCTLDCDRPYFRLGKETETHLFRIAQEAVNNAVAHGRANHIEINLKCENGKGLLSVLDDGVGIREEACHVNGIGLHTMAYRARTIGASLDLQRRNPKGTSVKCIFALDRTSKPLENADRA